MIIGITGPTGAGKTTALDALGELGFRLVDCDALYHELLRTSPKLKCAIEEAFPSCVNDNIVDRKRLASIVFSSSEELERLNLITHAAVKEEIIDIIANNPGVDLAIDAFALNESGIGELCDYTIAVIAPVERRIERIIQRDKLGRQEALARIEAQKSNEEYAAQCTNIITNDFDDITQYAKYCAEFFCTLKEKYMSELREKLFYSPKPVYQVIDEAESKQSEEYCNGYKEYLNSSKTEREAVTNAIKLAEAAGFTELKHKTELKPGTKIYRNVRGKMLLLAVIGTQTMNKGINIAAAHIDSPRLDLKQVPLYEDNGVAYFDTHYYGGIRKYQWVATPLALHGVVAKMDGSVVNIVIGEDENDPVLYISDLLPHLAKDQGTKPLNDAISGEGLNIMLGTLPLKDEEGSDKIKLAVMNILYEKYGITEEDFLSAELEVVPAAQVRDVGLDRSLIGGYGHDDRVCAYAELKAILDIDMPERTAVCILADKEEIGSEGTSGMQTEAFECFVGDLCDKTEVNLYHCLERSYCLSADVTNAFDPNFPEVSDKKNNTKLNYGLGICKFTGSRGKSGSNDASAEFLGRVRQIFNKEGVIWQTGELGKVDQGGGGTVAKYMAKRNIETVDAGVPVISMHSPYEVVSKLDCYMTYKGMKAFYKN